MYSQLFGLSLGRAFLKDSPALLAFAWAILMSLDILFSNFWGIVLKEWKGCKSKIIWTLAAGLAILIFSIFLPQLIG